MQDQQTVIAVQKLNKKFAKGPQALTDVDLNIKKGEIFGLLGPNGAGKTTLISIIAGLTKKTSGTVTVLGRDVVRDYRFTRKSIGLVQQEINADFFAKVIETVRFQAGYFGIRNPEKKIEEILKSLSLWEKRNVIGRKLSGGMKRRVMIAKALVHDPDILFLDEPTAGVDIELRANLWDLVRQLQKKGKTIILTTHYLEEAEELADRIGLINDGKIIVVEEKKQLMRRFGRERLCLQLDNKPDHVPEIVKKNNGELTDNTIEIFRDPNSKDQGTLQEMFVALDKEGIKVTHVDIKNTNLNDIYAHLINNDNSQEGK